MNIKDYHFKVWLKKPEVKLVLTFFIMTVLVTCKGLGTISSDKTSSLTVNVSIDTSVTKPISPYIYGTNGIPLEELLTAKAYRLGGNRTTGYNWENNFSQGGVDWRHHNDEHMSRGMDGTIPAITITNFVENAKELGAYALVTLPMAGYVANDNKLAVTTAETAPSSRFAQIINRKNGPLSLTPNLTDGIVYSDEFVNYLINKLGKAKNGGVNGYSLDNEPALWPLTHPRIHPQKTLIAELLEKSIALSSVVKDLDPDAEVFGPALYGLGAYSTFQNATDWVITYSKTYRWFVDAYLDEMRMAEEKNGRRLLDVLDIHYYTEARSPLGHRVCDDLDEEEDCIYTRFQSTRTLWDDTYKENSWVQNTLSRFLPVLPAVNQSIEKYYPGTKLAITEYDFGNESHISGGIAQADALGIFATHGVYLATLWPLTNDLEYAYAGINLYTNYDGSGGSFGSTLVKSTFDNVEFSSAYAATDKDGELHIILLNKNLHNMERFSISIQSDITYKNYTCYGFDSSSSTIRNAGSGAISGNRRNTCLFDIPPLSAYHFVLTP